MPILDKLYQANINPLYVNKFDTKDTFDDIIKTSEASDNLAATLKRDQVLNQDVSKNAEIFTRSLSALDKASESGDIHYRDKYKAVKKLAAAYVNDTERNAHLKSVSERESINKQLDEKDYDVFKPYIQGVNDSAYQGAKPTGNGGWQTYSATAMSPVKYVDQVKKANEIGTGFREEGNEKDGYYFSDGQGNRIQTSQTTEGVVPQEVKNFATQAWRNDIEFNKSETLSAEIKAVQDIQQQAAQQGINLTAAQARQYALNPNFKQEYIQKNVPKVNSKGQYIDEKGNVTKTPIYEDVKFEANPLDFAKKQREHEFVKMTTDKFSGFKTKFKVDERDDALWLYQFKRAAEKEDSASHATPVTTPTTEENTEYAISTLPEVGDTKSIQAKITELEADMAEYDADPEKMEGGIGDRNYTIFRNKQAELRHAKEDLANADDGQINNKVLKNNLQWLGYNPAGLTNKEGNALIKAWNNNASKFKAVALQLPVEATETLTKAVKIGGFEGGKLYVPSLGKSLTFDELLNDTDLVTTDEKGKELSEPERRQYFADKLNNAKIVIPNRKEDLRNGINVRYSLDLGGKQIQITPSENLNLAFQPLAELKRQQHDPKTSRKPVIVMDGTGKGTEYMMMYENGNAVLKRGEAGKWVNADRSIEDVASDVLRSYAVAGKADALFGFSTSEKKLNQN